MDKPVFLITGYKLDGTALSAAEIKGFRNSPASGSGPAYFVVESLDVVERLDQTNDSSIDLVTRSESPARYFISYPEEKEVRVERLDWINDTSTDPVTRSERRTFYFISCPEEEDVRAPDPDAPK